MNECERYLFDHVRLLQVALATASCVTVLSCSGCFREANSMHATVPSEQELLSPTVTILPAGTPVHVRLLKSLNTHKSEVIENVPFQVISTVSVGDFTVIERGASATGRAFITSPDGFTRKAQIYLVLDSTTAVTGTEIPLGGILNEMGGAFGASLEGYLGGEGGHAAVGDGTELEAFVAADVSQSTSKLQAFVNERRRISAQAFADQRLRMRLNIYLLSIDGTARIQVSLDGRKIGKVGGGERLTLLPSPGKHIIAVDDDKLALELTANGQYYVRVSEAGRWPRIKAHLKVVPPDQGQYEITDLVGVPPDQR